MCFNLNMTKLVMKMVIWRYRKIILRTDLRIEMSVWEP